MERRQGPINSCLYGEDFTENNNLIPRLNPSLEGFLDPIIEDQTTFHPMLQQIQSPFLDEQNIHSFLNLKQSQKSWMKIHKTVPEINNVQALETESCITNTNNPQSPVKSEKEEIGGEMFIPKQQSKRGSPQDRQHKRKRNNRLKSMKNREEVENQRMTHITVERNRRKLMNDHLAALRSLMLPSFVQRGDQASIIGGAINFVKELEQMLQSLQAQKHKQRLKEDNIEHPFHGFFISPQFSTYSNQSAHKCVAKTRRTDFREQSKLTLVDLEVTMAETHVNLKVVLRKNPRQLLRSIIALENIHLTVLHLTVTSSESSVLYSFNLKIEEECELSSADDIAGAVYQLFCYM